jgi:anti-anti-sigma regulatory factor
MAPDERKRTPPPVPGTVEVEIHPPGVAIVMVRGEHDLSKPEPAEDLARASDQPDVLVDLPECTFRDSSVIATLVEASTSLWERDRRLELVITPEAHAFQRVAKIAGIHMFSPIDETRSARIVSIQGEA